MSEMQTVVSHTGLQLVYQQNVDAMSMWVGLLGSS